MDQPTVSLEIGLPVLIAQTAPDVRGWGYYQFPEIEKTAAGSLHVRYHVRPDSAHAYGLAKGHAFSADNGLTWTAGGQEPSDAGLLLPNGDRLRIKHLPAINASQIDLPGAPIDQIQSYSALVRIYDATGFPPETKGWPLERLAAGSADWVLDIKPIEYPGEIRHIVEGVLPMHMFWRLRLAPDHTIWGIAYTFVNSGRNPIRCQPLFFTSRDNGRTFQFLSTITYQPLPEIDRQYSLRGGFGEPDVAFLPDGSIFCLLRTTDGHGIGPLYGCRSRDGGKTWSRPAFFDGLGVWPTLLTLKNGVTLVSYGRPGLYLRATGSPAADRWDERVTIVTPLDYQTDTCSYSDMVAIADDSVFLVYSDFNYPNPAGVPVKSILGRKITARVAS